jgi:RNA polymerase sigma factor (sigma-70 family)
LLVEPRQKEVFQANVFCISYLSLEIGFTIIINIFVQTGNSKERINPYLKLYPDDIELVEKLQKGDIEAFDLLYEKYSGKLYCFGLKYLKSTDEAQELVQSVFLKLWENYKTLKKESSFKSYLFTIAYNDICKLFRKRSYNQKFIDETLYENSQSSSQSEESIDYQSVLTRVRKIIDNLPERQRTIFEKSRFEGK